MPFLGEYVRTAVILMNTTPFQIVLLPARDGTMGMWNYVSKGHPKMMLGALLRTLRKSAGGSRYERCRYRAAGAMPDRWPGAGGRGRCVACRFRERPARPSI